MTNYPNEKNQVKYRIYSLEQAFRHMTLDRPEKEQQLYMITDDILFNVWDAQCLSIDQDFREEYLPYLPHAFDLLVATDTGEELFDYLVFVEETKMSSISNDHLIKKRAKKTVEVLLKQKALIYKNSKGSL